MLAPTPLACDQVEARSRRDVAAEQQFGSYPAAGRAGEPGEPEAEARVVGLGRSPSPAELKDDPAALAPDGVAALPIRQLAANGDLE